MGGFAMTRREFFQDGKEIQAEPLHYTTCGLDDVYLLSGFTRKSTPYGDGVTISNIDGLHRAIGLSLIVDRKALSPKELRFLRKELDMTQADLGRALRLSDQQVARWEKGECAITGPAEVAMRLLFAVELVPARKRGAFMANLVKALNELALKDETRPNKLVFTETDMGWIKTATTRELACVGA
ncbi:helix-turn-helix domain-containing protein [Rhizomicrobium electricum]|nr:helix-turn-helix domain-containing protein [Rhizomicrobium electricum]